MTVNIVHPILILPLKEKEYPLSLEEREGVR